jgi:hypothetical protein
VRIPGKTLLVIYGFLHRWERITTAVETETERAEGEKDPISQTFLASRTSYREEEEVEILVVPLEIVSSFAYLAVLVLVDKQHNCRRSRTGSSFNRKNNQCIYVGMWC